VLQNVSMNSGAEGETTTFVVISFGAGALVAICGVILAWLKWRHPPDNK